MNGEDDDEIQSQNLGYNNEKDHTAISATMNLHDAMMLDPAVVEDASSSAAAAAAAIVVAAAADVNPEDEMNVQAEAVALPIQPKSLDINSATATTIMMLDNADTSVPATASADAVDTTPTEDEVLVQPPEVVPVAPPVQPKSSDITTTTSVSCDDDDNNIETIRLRKRRKLQRMIDRSGGYPSFVGLLTATYENGSDDDNDDETEGGHDSSFVLAAVPGVVKKEPVLVKKERTPILIDVDVELGLKERPARTAKILIKSEEPVRPEPSKPMNVTASASAALALSKRNTPLTAAEEGWYEGVVSPMTLVPEDADYLNEFQQWIRQNLEFFSATDTDAAAPKDKRRTATVKKGRVGIRCIHCAKAILSSSATSSNGGDTDDEERRGSITSNTSIIRSKNKTWPPGAISYPNNISGIHSACTQKPLLHFTQHCPNLSEDEKERFLILSRENSIHKNTNKRSRSSASSSFERGGDNNFAKMPVPQYYILSAKRIGLVETVDDGIRFGRDLALPPLPTVTIRAHMDAELSSSRAMIAAAAAGGGGGGTASSIDPTVVVSSEPRITADEESERVLAEAVVEKDNPAKYLSLSEDKSLVTDYFFLTIRQMAICFAMPCDMTRKGKQTKLMRIGLAGFCCRHCMQPDGVAPSPTDFSCRSFASAADNLSSSIANSFSNHLLKCYKVPAALKKALAAYRRLHQRQLAQVAYGSQRRLIHELWARLRAADISVEEMQERIRTLKPAAVVAPPPVIPMVSSTSTTTSTVPAADDEAIVPMEETTSMDHQSTEITRPESFPVCEDEETMAILKNAEENWDPAVNDHLILPSERWFVSDYVFLAMRQLKVAIPVASDSARFRRGGGVATAGICCLHCMDRPAVVSPSGRSFPTAPDNFASAINASLYSHMQACGYVPDDLKRALAHTRKIHSLQCSSLRFGSQRRFFNLLHHRLQQYHVHSEAEQDQPANGSSEAFQSESFLDPELAAVAPTAAAITEPSTVDLSRYGFIEVAQVYACRNCRMVPLQFRARGSFCFTRPTEHDMQEHSSRCKADSFDLDLVAYALDMFVLHDCQEDTVEIIDSELFKELVNACVAGNSEFTRIFVDDVKRLVLMRRRDDELSHDDDSLQRSKGLWSRFPINIDNTRIMNAFRAIAEEHSGLSSRLEDNLNLVNYLLLISPALDLGKISETTEAST